MESEKVKEIRQIMIDTNKELEEIFKNSFDKISLQKRRSYLVNKIAAFESDAKSKDMVNVLQKEYEILPPVFDDCNIQTVLDEFDFHNAARTCRELNYRYGFNEEKITEEMLIKDAFDILKYLSNSEHSSLTHQIGRLIGVKTEDYENPKEPIYKLIFFVEMSEN